MRPHGSPKQLESRRRRAMALLEAGKTYQSVATKVNSSLSSVVRWSQDYREGGMDALAPRPVPGRPSKLSAKEKKKLLRILKRGPKKEGYSTDVWTLQRITKLIQKHFGVQYHPGHVWWLLGSLGLTCQKPERRATERDEEAIAHWKRYTWPRIKKNQRAQRAPGVSRRKRVPSHPKRPKDMGSDR